MHPWKEISLDDYENHMRLASVRQLQTMNAMMAAQLAQPGISSVMLLGAAGGNGLEHAVPRKPQKIFAVDINAEYLRVCRDRFPELDGVMDCICADLSTEPMLPHADLVIANLLVEYIGYPCFQQVIQTVQPKFVSCGIQINTDNGFVSDSPYLHVFDRLEEVHRQMDAAALTAALSDIGYRLTGQHSHPLPNGKQLMRLDFSNIM